MVAFRRFNVVGNGQCVCRVAHISGIGDGTYTCTVFKYTERILKALLDLKDDHEFVKRPDMNERNEIYK